MFEKLFGAFESAQQTMTEITMAANQKADAAKEVAQVTAREKAKVQDIAANYSASADVALWRLDTIKAQGDEARRMAESDNIIDRISLIGDQLLNPRAYTAEGRSRQVQEMSQILAVEGQASNIKIAGSQAIIDQAQAEADAKTAGVDAKLNTMKIQVDALSLMNQGITQAESLRQNQLALLPQEEIQKTMMGPISPDMQGKGGKIKVNGFEYTPAELMERNKQLETRKQLAMLGPQATDADYAAKLRVHQDLQLANFSLPELMKLKEDGYIMPDGKQVDPQLWDSHYQRQNALQADALKIAINSATVSAQVPTMLAESQALITNTKKYATPGSPLAAAVNQFQAQANTMADLSAMPDYAKNPNVKITQVAGLQQAQQDLVKAVDQEATRMSAGNKELADIYRNQILGMPISSTQVDDVIRQAYVKGGSFGTVLSQESNIRIRKAADDNFAKLRQQEAQAALGGLQAKRSDKELKEEAVNLALETERGNQGVSGANIIKYKSAERADNPAVKSGMLPAMIRDVEIRANTGARTEIMRQYGLTDNQMNAIQRGEGALEGVTPEKAAIIARAYNTESTMQEYMMYEKHKPGLGYEMQQWLTGAMPEMARAYQASLPPTEAAMVGDAVLRESQKLGEEYTQADEAFSRRGAAAVMEVSTGVKKPENMWPMLLQSDKRLADSQKHSIYYDVIEPTITAARAQGANDQTATDRVFEALSRFKSDDPVLNSSVKMMLRDLPDNMDTFQQMWTVAMAQKIGPSGGAIGLGGIDRQQMTQYDPNAAGQAVKSALPWMNQK